MPPDFLDEDPGSSEDNMETDIDDYEFSDPMVSYLVGFGCDPTEAHNKICSMKRSRPAKFVEVYGQGTINRMANEERRDLNLKGVGALDLRTKKADGTPGTLPSARIGSWQGS